MGDILRMKYPAAWWRDMWREGLPTGNGFTGANLYGGAKREILQLSRHDFWYDGAEEEVPDVREAFVRLREKMERGEYREAGWEIVNALGEKGYGSRLETHIPLARLVVMQDPVRGFRHFERTLDMSRALACQQWEDEEIRMCREVFVSRPRDVAVYRISARPLEESTPGGGKAPRGEGPAAGDWRECLRYELRLGEYVNEGQPPTEALKGVWKASRTRVVCEGDAAYLFFSSEREGKSGPEKFGAVTRVTIGEGRMEISRDILRISGADEILAVTAVWDQGSEESAVEKLQDLPGYEELLRESVPLHEALYRSAELSLGGGQGDRPNEDLTAEAFSDRQSVELIEKLWHFGRYLFICGSSPQSNPFPLYGLWGGSHRPQWCHNMANENLQMIYWHSLCGNLAEYNEAVFRYMNDRVPAFRDNGRKLFGIDGIYMTAGTTPGVSSPTQVVPVIINWVGAAGWIAQHYYRYFCYTQNMRYAEETMIPYLDGVAAFYEGFVCFADSEDGGERIRWYPSVSPENTPSNYMPPDGEHMAHPMPTTVNSTIDLAIVKEFFTNLLKLRERFWEERGERIFSEERVRLWKRILAAIPEFRCNEDGAVREWQEDIFEDRYDHRHLSHIYPVFPGDEVYPTKDPERIPAYERAVKLRKIDAQTGWSMAHMAAVYARFRDGEAAMECLDNLAKSCLLNNFFTLHNDWRGMNISLNMDPAPVQLDAIMGYVNAVQEMILYAAQGYLALLPALEERLYEGHVRNFRYQDGLLEMAWDVKAGVFRGKIIPLRPHTVQIRMPDFAGKPVWSGIPGERVKACAEATWEIRLDTEEVCWRAEGI